MGNSPSSQAYTGQGQYNPSTNQGGAFGAHSQLDHGHPRRASERGDTTAGHAGPGISTNRSSQGLHISQGAGYGGSQFHHHQNQNPSHHYQAQQQGHQVAPQGYAQQLQYHQQPGYPGATFTTFSRQAQQGATIQSPTTSYQSSLPTVSSHGGVGPADPYGYGPPPGVGVGSSGSYRPHRGSVGSVSGGYNRAGHQTPGLADTSAVTRSVAGGGASAAGLRGGGMHSSSATGTGTGDSGGNTSGTAGSPVRTREDSKNRDASGNMDGRSDTSGDGLSEENYQAAKRGRAGSHSQGTAGHSNNNAENNGGGEGRAARSERERDRDDRRKKPGGSPSGGASGSGSGSARRSSASKVHAEPQPRLNEDEYEFIARDIMSKPPFAGYLKYHLPVRYAARCEEVRWEWVDSAGRLCRQELIGGGKNSDLEYD